MPGAADRRPPTADQLPVAVPPRPLDFDSYGIATTTETQCPHCGSFDTERTGAHAQQTANCHTCHHSWSIDDGAPLAAAASGKAVGIGALAIGNIKYQVERGLFQSMCASEQPLYLDFRHAFAKARELAGGPLSAYR